MKMLLLPASLALLLALAPSARAAVIYEEVTSLDDLPIDAPYPVLPLALGTNSVLGGTSFSGDAVDSFAVSVPAGLELESITYVYTISALIRGGGSLTEAISGFSLVSGDGTAPQPGSLLAVQNVDMVPGLCSPFVGSCGPSSPSAVFVELFADALPREAGIYSVEQRALTVSNPETTTWNSTYRIDLLVVPEPTTLFLACAGLVLLSVRSRPPAAARGRRSQRHA